MKVTKFVQVTAKDIREGKKQHCFKCPVARALSRIVKGLVKVRLYHFSIGDEGWVHMPRDLSNFIERFDKGQSVKPTRFKFDIPVEFLKKPVKKETNSNEFSE